MSLIARAQAAEAAVQDMAAKGPGLLHHHERAAHEAIAAFVHHALRLPDNPLMPDDERRDLRAAIGRIIAAIEALPASSLKLAEAIYQLRAAEERIASTHRI